MHAKDGWNLIRFMDYWWNLKIVIGIFQVMISFPNKISLFWYNGIYWLLASIVMAIGTWLEMFLLPLMVNHYSIIPRLHFYTCYVATSRIIVRVWTHAATKIDKINGDNPSTSLEDKKTQTAAPRGDHSCIKVNTKLLNAAFLGVKLYNNNYLVYFRYWQWSHNLHWSSWCYEDSLQCCNHIRYAYVWPCRAQLCYSGMA